MDTLQPSIPLCLLGGHAGIVAPALIRIVNKPVWLPGPDQLGDGIDQGMDFSFGSLARGDVDPGNDDILAGVVRIHVRGGSLPQSEGTSLPSGEPRSRQGP